MDNFESLLIDNIKDWQDKCKVADINADIKWGYVNVVEELIGTLVNYEILVKGNTPEGYLFSQEENFQDVAS